jgi:hypothetical protein
MNDCCCYNVAGLGPVCSLSPCSTYGSGTEVFCGSEVLRSRDLALAPESWLAVHETILWYRVASGSKADGDSWSKIRYVDNSGWIGLVG